MKFLNYYIKESVQLLIESKQQTKDIIKKQINSSTIDKTVLDNIDNFVDTNYSLISDEIKEPNIRVLFLVILYFEFDKLDNLLDFYADYYIKLKKYNLKLPNTLNYYMDKKNIGHRNGLYELFTDDVINVLNKYTVIKFAKKFIKGNYKLKQFIMNNNTILELIGVLKDYVDDGYEFNKLDRIQSEDEFIKYLEDTIEEFDTESITNIRNEIKNINDAILVHDNNGLVIAQVNTKVASRALGCNDTWCISYLDNTNQWNTYINGFSNTVQFFAWDFTLKRGNLNSKIAFTYDYQDKEITYAHARNDSSIIDYAKNKFDSKFIDSIIDFESLYKLFPDNYFLKYKINPTEENKNLYILSNDIDNNDITDRDIINSYIDNGIIYKLDKKRIIKIATWFSDLDINFNKLNFNNNDYINLILKSRHERNAFNKYNKYIGKITKEDIEKNVDIYDFFIKFPTFFDNYSKDFITRIIKGLTTTDLSILIGKDPDYLNKLDINLRNVRDYFNSIADIIDTVRIIPKNKVKLLMEYVPNNVKTSISKNSSMLLIIINKDLDIIKNDKSFTLDLLSFSSLFELVSNSNLNTEDTNYIISKLYSYITKDPKFTNDYYSELRRIVNFNGIKKLFNYNEDFKNNLYYKSNLNEDNVLTVLLKKNPEYILKNPLKKEQFNYDGNISLTQLKILKYGFTENDKHLINILTDIVNSSNVELMNLILEYIVDLDSKIDYNYEQYKPPYIKIENGIVYIYDLHSNVGYKPTTILTDRLGGYSEYIGHEYALLAEYVQTENKELYYKSSKVRNILQNEIKKGNTYVKKTVGDLKPINEAIKKIIKNII